MKIIQLINEFTNTFNENLNFLNLESKIRTVGDTFTLLLYEKFLNYIDDKFRNLKENQFVISKKLEKELLLLL